MTEGRTDDMLWEGEQGFLPFECAVEPLGEVAAELDMLLLVLTDRNLSGPASRSAILDPQEHGTGKRTGRPICRQLAERGT